MSGHVHPSSEDICLRVGEVSDSSNSDFLESLRGCPSCEAEAEAARRLFAELRQADSLSEISSDWADLLLRKRIRDAVALERPHSRTFFGRFGLWRPALVTATVAILALAVLNPIARPGGSKEARVAQDALAAWVPLPDESEDEGLAVLAEWTPNADELELAGCHAACLAGLTSHEEEGILRSMTDSGARTPPLGPSPL